NCRREIFRISVGARRAPSAGFSSAFISSSSKRKLLTSGSRTTPDASIEIPPTALCRNRPPCPKDMFPKGPIMATIANSPAKPQEALERYDITLLLIPVIRDHMKHCQLSGGLRQV